MSFSGKATYSAGSGLPEIAEDLGDLIGISSPYETPLLDALGDPVRPARSTLHEWLEDALLPNSDTVAANTFVNALTDTTLHVSHAARFRVGDQVELEGGAEVMLVSAVDAAGGEITVVRGYGVTTPTALGEGLKLNILGNAALEGDASAAARFTMRSRKCNYTQIFAASAEVSGSELAAKQVGVADELDYQKQQRLRELMRDMENCVINGVAPAATPEGSGTVRRTMRGIRSFIATHQFKNGENSFPATEALSEEQLNVALRRIWEQSNGQVDLIVVNGDQKRAINKFVATSRRFLPETESYKDMVSTYESDYGICKIVLSRWVPKGTALLLDSSRIEVMPLVGRSFHYKPLAATGDRESGQVIGEYTLEMRNENAHGVITGLDG